MSTLSGSIDEGRNTKHVIQMAVWKAVTFDILHPRVPYDGSLEGELTHIDKVYKEALKPGDVPPGSYVFNRDFCQTCDAEIDERKVVQNRTSRCWCPEHDRNDQVPRMHPPPYVYHGKCKVRAVLKQFYIHNGKKAISVCDFLTPYFHYDLFGTGNGWLEAECFIADKFRRGCLPNRQDFVPSARWMQVVKGFIITGRSSGASSGAEGLPFRARTLAVAGVWAEPSPADAAYSASRLMDANLAAMAADRALRAAADAVAMPPPPPPIAFRSRGVPPAPKVPLWQADAYLALAKVSGEGPQRWYGSLDTQPCSWCARSEFRSC